MFITHLAVGKSITTEALAVAIIKGRKLSKVVPSFARRRQAIAEVVGWLGILRRCQNGHVPVGQPPEYSDSAATSSSPPSSRASTGPT